MSYGASQLVLVVKKQPANTGNNKRCKIDPWVRKIPLEEGIADRGAWWATVHRVAKSYTRLR